jgi:hypothetical protein
VDNEYLKKNGHFEDLVTDLKVLLLKACGFIRLTTEPRVGLLRIQYGPLGSVKEEMFRDCLTT